MTSPIERMIDAVCKCTICGAAPGKCNCWEKKIKKIKQPHCTKCKKLAEFVMPSFSLCERHYAEHLTDELKPKTPEQRVLWLKQIKEVLRGLK